ncbi:MAG: gamma-glutamylcyclotransferase family protein [Bacteroidota bacterium]
MDKLFVYGTLCPGQPNHHLLENIGGTWEKGIVRGILYPEGWGAALGYPAMILDEKGGIVEGYLFSSDNLMMHWDDLDAFEGEGYERVRTDVELENKSIVEAFVYTLRPLSESK